MTADPVGLDLHEENRKAVAVTQEGLPAHLLGRLKDGGVLCHRLLSCTQVATLAQAWLDAS